MLKNKTFSEDEPVKVSVAMIAYNVERYIEEAIESVLTQKVDFRVELVIGEDCSTDSTRTIALSYKEKYPSIIRVLLPPKNQGLTPNCVATINECQGEYVALLDSDDYWTSDNKLAMQVDFLDTNSDYSGSGHQSMKIYDDKSAPESFFGEQVDKDYFVKDMITHRKFHTSSFIFRREYWVKSGGIPPSISSNERGINPMVAIFGKIKYFKENMCVYRFSGFGLSSRVDYKELETDLAMLPWLKSIDASFPTARFRSFIHLCAYTYGTKKAPFFPRLKHYFSFLFYSFSYFPKNLGDAKWGTIFFIKKTFEKRRSDINIKK